MGQGLLALLAGLSACALLVYNTALRPMGTLGELRGDRRYWEDLCIGASQSLERDAGEEVPTVGIASHEATDLRHAYKRYLIRSVEQDRIRPWELWRTVPIKRFLKRERVVPRDYDDPGRPALIGAGFRALGGVSPYLGLWLGTLLCLPVLLWSAFELHAGGRPVAGTLFPLATAASCFVVDTLTLPYSAVGFYVVAVVVLANLAAYGALGSSRSILGLVARLLGAGAIFALCALCRGSTMALLPGYLVAIGLAVGRVLGTRRGAAGLAVGGAALFLLPYLAVRQPHHHAVWGDIWQGLGDFDTTKGHTWSDPALRRLLRKHGMRLHRQIGVEFESDESERITRRIVLDHVTQDPAWFGRIVVKRIAATLTQWKLRAYGPRDGFSFFPTTRRNAGTIDRYYRMAANADVFGVGGWRRELPLTLLLAPAALLLASWLGSSRFSPLTPWRERLGSSAACIGCVALGAAMLPVVITTGSLEMQAFALAYLLSFALLAEELAGAIRRRPAAAAATP